MGLSQKTVRGEKGFTQKIASTVGASFQISGFVQVEKEEGHFGQCLFLQLGSVTFFDLLQVEYSLPFGVGLVGTPQKTCHFTLVLGKLGLERRQFLLDQRRLLLLLLFILIFLF